MFESFEFFYDRRWKGSWNDSRGVWSMNRGNCEKNRRFETLILWINSKDFNPIITPTNNNTL